MLVLMPYEPSEQNVSVSATPFTDNSDNKHKGKTVKCTQFVVKNRQNKNRHIFMHSPGKHADSFCFFAEVWI